MAERKSDKEQRIHRAFNRYQHLIDAGLEQRRKMLASVGEVVTLRNGVSLIIQHTAQGYQVAGLAAPARLMEMNGE